MQGTIQNPATQNGQGVILGDDGVTYAYTMLGWRDATATASPGMRVDFDTRGSHAVAIYPVPDALRPLGNTMSPPMAPQPPSAAPAPGGYTSPRQPSPIPTTGHVGASPNAPGQPAHATGYATSSPFVPRQPTHIPTTGHVSSSPISPGQPTRTPMAGHVGAAPATAGQMANFPTAGQAASPPIAAGPGAQHPAAPAGVPGTAAPRYRHSDPEPNCLSPPLPPFWPSVYWPSARFGFCSNLEAMRKSPRKSHAIGPTPVSMTFLRWQWAWSSEMRLL